MTIGAAKAVPQRGELAIVIIEVEMVHRVAGSAVDDGRFRNVFAVVYKGKIQLRGMNLFRDKTRLTNKDGPYVDENEKRNISKLLKRKNIGVRVIWHALRKPV